ncbi:MAG: ATP-dependent protease LonB [Candidatus Diapherotrites archaeon]|nr:ATP-dependent protease LonB [Candidatus Diapherotrites archaeon]
MKKAPKKEKKGKIAHAKARRQIPISEIPGDWNSTSEIAVPERIIDQVIGQDNCVELIKKAAMQKRNVLLVGLPGTGKSMLAQAMAEILPVQKMQDILVYPNPLDSNSPKVKMVDAGKGKQIVNTERMNALANEHNSRMLAILFPLGFFILSSFMWSLKWISDVIFAATIILGGILLMGFVVASQMRMRFSHETPKLLIDNSEKKTAPFIEATGSRAGSLLGDVLHDPLQSGGLGTPAHLRVEPGAIHKANGGVLFLDEIATLSPKAQQELLTAMQEKKYPITGQSENSSGAMVRTEAVPCDFVLVAAGNYEDLQKVHPALRSRIRGYGYEIYMNWDMPDTEENRKKIVQFIAQEIKKDGRIPAFSRDAAEAIIFEARRRATKKNTLTLKLRDLGGLIRASGDIAAAKQHKIVVPEDLQEAKISAKTLEQQIAGKIIEDRKAYEVYFTQGTAVGRVNGLAVSGEGDAGLVLPIEAEIAPAASKSEGKLIATGKLGEIAKEAVQNVSALIKKLSGKDVSKYDLHIQFLQTYEGVEGDSASISVATAVISALEGIPIKQNLAMTGSLSVRGEVLPVAGITAKVQAAIKAGFSEVIIPKANLEDVVLGKKELQNIRIIPVSTLSDVLSNAFEKSGAKVKLLSNLKKIIELHIPVAGIGKISRAGA